MTILAGAFLVAAMLAGVSVSLVTVAAWMGATYFALRALGIEVQA